MQTIEIPTDDAVAMVRAIRDRHYEETKDMTPEEKWEYDQRRLERGRQKLAATKPDPSRFPFLAKKS